MHPNHKPTYAELLAQNQKLELQVQQLKKLEEKYRLITENAEDVIWTTDLDLNITFISGSIYKVSGFTPRECYSRSFDEQFSQASALELRKAFEYYFQKLSHLPDDFAQTFKAQVRHKQGGMVWTEIKARLLTDSQGKLVGLHGITRDISDKVRLEEELKTKEIQAHNVLNSIQDGILILDADMKILQVNSTVEHWFASKKIIGKRCHEIFRPGGEACTICPSRQTLADGKSRREEKPRYSRTGEQIGWFEVFSFPLLANDSKKIVGVIEYVRDITERKKTQAALSESERKYKKIAENLQEAIEKEQALLEDFKFLSKTALGFVGLTFKDDFWKYIGQNLHAACTDALIVVEAYQPEHKTMQIERVQGIDQKILADWQKRNAIGNSYRLSPEMYQDFLEKRGELIQFKGSFEDFAGHILSKEMCKKVAEKYQIAQIYYMVFGKKDQIFGRLVMLKSKSKNTTIKKQRQTHLELVQTYLHQVGIALERIHLENELLRAKEHAENADRLKTVFLENISHEIRTPMNSIAGFADMLHKPELPDQKKLRFIEIIQTNVRSLLQLVTDIMDVSKIETGQIKLNFHEVSLKNLMQELNLLFEAQQAIEQKNLIELSLAIPAGAHNDTILTDSFRLKQVLKNLIDNAFKFTKKGEIQFGYQIKDQQTVLFWVKDTGIGIPKDKQTLIFDRFRQAYEGTKRLYGGTGIGLAICKGLVKLLGGEIWLHSELHKGACFYFTIPYRTLQTPA